MHNFKLARRYSTDVERTRLGTVVLPTEAGAQRSCRPLEKLPISALLRSLLVNTIITSPFLNRASMEVLRRAMAPASFIFNPEENPALRCILRSVAYYQFCAGITPLALKEKIQSLRSVGFRGVILCYGKEVVLPNSHKNNAETGIYEQADFDVSRAGRIATDALRAGRPMPSVIEEAMAALCEASANKGVRCVFDAEQAILQLTIDVWVIDLMRKYNRNGVAVDLGIKLVRGPYIDSDPRNLCELPFAAKHLKFPKTQLFMATHNVESVRRAMETYRSRVNRREPSVLLEFGQLQGMADDVSCELLQEKAGNVSDNVPGVYKYLT
ncbi:proline dehydrogenase [Trichoderma evansii]